MITALSYICVLFEFLSEIELNQLLSKYHCPVHLQAQRNPIIYIHRAVVSLKYIWSTHILLLSQRARNAEIWYFYSTKIQNSGD